MSLSERLGYPSNSKILVVQADDLGMANSINQASIKALDAGLVTSAGIMIPTPWTPEIISYFVLNPKIDFGLHLTLTSEWTLYRWRPVLSEINRSSLVDSQGYFYFTAIEAGEKINPVEAELELQAQIDYALMLGLHPSYLDCHMFTLYKNEMLFEVFLRVSRRNGIPALIYKDVFNYEKLPYSLISPNEIVIETTLRIRGDILISPEYWDEYYVNLLKQLKPGISALNLHLAYDNEEMQAITQGIDKHGSAWRQRDFDFLNGGKFRQVIEEQSINTISWREIGHKLL